MVRETRHLWVGNLPDNIREDRIREHFKRYGRVQSVKLLSRSSKEEAGENSAACTVAFMDIKSASKAHTAEHKIDEKTLTTEYYEPAAIPSTASPQNTNSAYSTSPGSTRFTNSHGTLDEHGNFNDRFYDRNSTRVVADSEYIRRQNYHDGRSRNRDRAYRNGPYNNVNERHRSLNSSWSYDSSRSYSSETGYGTPTDTNDKRSSDSQSTTAINSKKKTKSPSESRSVSPSGSNTSRSPSRSRSQSSSSSSSSTTSQETSSTSSRKSRRMATSNSSHQPVVHSDDRRPLAICVKNLPLRSSDTSLKDGLFHEYKKHGKVTWVKIVGQASDRHAIVCFKKPEDVDKAIEVSYDKLFFGCKIEVAPYQGYDVDDNELRPYEAEIDEFHPKATRTLFIGNLEKDFTASDLRKHFDQFGEIIEIDIKKQGAVTSYAFCQYSDIISVVKAIRAMDGEHLGNNRIKLGFGKSMPTNCVWVDGVVNSVTDKYLTLQFDSFGPISQVIIDRDKGQALIFYEQVANAQVAVTKMRGVTLRGRKVQVDFASRECQESFYEHLEKQGHSTDRQTTNFEEKRDAVSSVATTPRFTRYETPSRPRSTSYNSNRTTASTGQCNTPSILHSPGTPGSVTPRGSGSRSRSRIADYYDQVSVNSVDFVDRRYRSYDEFSQSSAASHEDVFEHDHRESPIRVDHNDHALIATFPPPEMRILQKERFHLLEQLDDYTSSGDELINPKKRLRLDLDNSLGSDVIIEANRDHRKVTEVRRTSDGSIKHYSRRPSVDSNKHSYLPHAVCKRRKTGGSDSSSKLQHHDLSGSESVESSRPGTPLCDERPENIPSEPRRVPRDREGPLSLPLPRFAAQVMGKGSVSVAGIKGQKDNVLSSPPPAVTSPRISNPPTPGIPHVPPPASPPPRPPSPSSNSSDSDITPPSPSLDERIRSLDEKYEKWSGSRSVSAAGSDALAKLDASASERFRFSYKLLDLDLKELQPSEIVKSVLAKPSVFDEDLKRLENVNEKYDFNLFTKTSSVVTPSTTTVPLPASPVIKVITTTAATQLPKPSVTLSPRSSGTNLPTAKGLQYPFPSHPPVQPATPTQLPSSTTPRSNHGENKLKPCVSVSVNDIRTSAVNSKIVLNRTGSNNLPLVKTNEPTNNNKSSNSSSDTNVTETNTKQIKSVRDKNSEKVAHRRDSTNSCELPRSEVNNRRNSENGGRKSDSNDKQNDNICDTSTYEDKRKAEEEKKRLEQEKLEQERLEKQKLEKERLEKERQEKAEKERLERLEKERIEKERLEKESLEKERLEKERIEKERLEQEHKREREEKERREREEKERKEREEKERREQEEQERLDRERKERKEKEDKERREREEREKREKEEKDRKREEERKHREDLLEKQHTRHHNDNKHHKDSSSIETSRTDKNTKDRAKENHELNINRLTHEKHHHNSEKSKHHSHHGDSRDIEKRKESVKENRENNLHDKIINEIKEHHKIIESRHISIDLDKNRIDPCRRKERNNSIPITISSKRRMSLQDSLDVPDESKKIKLNHEHKKLSERRDSKDSIRSEEKIKTKHKNNIAKIIEDKIRNEKFNSVKEDTTEDKRKEDKHKHKQKGEKQKLKDKIREKEITIMKTPSAIIEKEFLAKLDLQSTDDIERVRQRKEAKEKFEDIKKSDEYRKEKRASSERRSRDEISNSPTKKEETKIIKKERTRKITHSSDAATDSDEPKKQSRSIFDIVDDEPAYISMYDKVKARSCKNMQKQVEEKRQEQIKAKFSQLKQSRAKREEKKRSTSWDEDSDSEHDQHSCKMDSNKNRKGSKALVMSSDDEEIDSHNRHRKKKDVYSESDCEKSRQNIESSDEEDSKRHLHLKDPGHFIDDDFKRMRDKIKAEIFSDSSELDQRFIDLEEKVHKKIKDEDIKFIKKEKKKRSHHLSADEIKMQIFGDSPLPEIKTEDNFDNGQLFGDASSGDENHDSKKEIRKKHRKKNKRQKYSITSEEETKLELTVELIKDENIDRMKSCERKKQHGKKDRKKDKIKDEHKERTKRSRRAKSEIKSECRRDGKLENIFGSFSEASDNDKEHDQTYMDQYIEEKPHMYVSDSDSISHMEKEIQRTEEMERREKRKERKRLEKEKRLREEENDNSMDYADLGKQLEDNIKDDSNDIIETIKCESEEKNEDPPQFTEGDADDSQGIKEVERKEKKKKRKKSRDEKHKYHHHHHDKSKTSKSPEPVDQEFEFSSSHSEKPLLQSVSLPNLLDLPSPPLPNKMELSNKKRDIFIPEFGVEVDETAVKSISEEFEPPKPILETAIEIKQEEVKLEKPEINDDKPRVIISQEETEDAVAALLGESFSNTNNYPSCYSGDSQSNIIPNEHESHSQETVPEDLEEMRQAVQNLNSGELEVKPDTPQSEHELQIDTDTEETDDAGLRFDQSPRTPEGVDLSHPPKTPDIPSYFKPEDQPPKTLVIKATITNPPSLTPIKQSDGKKVDTLENSVMTLPISETRTYSIPIKIEQAKKDLPESVTVKPYTLTLHMQQQQQKFTFNRVPITPIMMSKPFHQTTVTLPQPKVAQTSDTSTPSNKEQIHSQSRVIFQGLPSQVPKFLLNSQNSQTRMIVQNMQLPRTIIRPSGNYTGLPSNPYINQMASSEPPKLVPTSHPLSVASETLPAVVADAPKLVSLSSSTLIQPSIIQSAIVKPTLVITTATIAQAVKDEVAQVERASSSAVIGDESAKTIKLEEEHKQEVQRKTDQPVHSQIVTPLAPQLLQANSQVVTPASLPPILIDCQTTQYSEAPLKLLTQSLQTSPHISFATSPQVTHATSLQGTTTKPQGTAAMQSETSSKLVENPLSFQTQTASIQETPQVSPQVVQSLELPQCRSPEQKLAIEQVTDELNLSLKKAEHNAPLVESLTENCKSEITESKFPKLSSDPDEMIDIRINDKIEDDKGETESIESDISKERLSTDISKDDGLDSKEDSDYWSAKEVNIDSVIKKVDALCSADELSDRSSEISKDDWFDVKTEIPQEIKTIEPITKISEAPEQVVTRGARRAGRQRGRRMRGGVTTRRSRANKDTEINTNQNTPSRRGGRTGRARVNMNVTKPEIGSSDIYEFRDESDENKDRPRLILTIKSPANPNNGTTQTSVVKELPKEIITPPKGETKEDFISPTTNTRKSRRLQERGGESIKTSVDDTIEDVIRNNNVIVTRSAAVVPVTPTRRSTRQIAAKSVPESSPHKSPRSVRRKDRRTSDTTTDDSSEEKSTKNIETISESLELCKSAVTTPAEETESSLDSKIDLSKDKPHEGLKATVLRRVKGEMNIQEPMTLIDPVTGVLIPMRECEEGRYIPVGLAGGLANQAQIAKVIVTSGNQVSTSETVSTQTSVEPSLQPVTTAASVIQQQKSQQPLKAHVLSTPHNRVIITSTQSQLEPSPKVVTLTVAPPVSSQGVVVKTGVPITQHVNVNIPTSNIQPVHISPKPLIAPNASKPILKITQTAPSMSHILTQINQSKHQQINKPIVGKPHLSIPVSSNAINSQLAHVKQQVAMAQVQVIKPHSLHSQQQILTAAVASPPLKQSHHITQSPMTGSNSARLTQLSATIPNASAKSGMEPPPKVDVSMAGCVIVPHPTSSPQGPQGQVRIPIQSGLPLPPYEANVGDTMTHFPPNSVKLRTPHELIATHFIHPQMYQQYLRQAYHVPPPRSPLIVSNLEKGSSDGQEGEEAPVELRRPASVGTTLTGRSPVVPHSLQSPHERTTDSPQVGQVYVHNSRLPHYHPNRYFEQGEPPPAHRTLGSHASLPTLGNPDRPIGLTTVGTPERPHSSHLTPDRPLSSHLIPDRPLSTSTLSSNHTNSPGPITHLPPPDRPLSGHSFPLITGMGPAGNLMGAVIRHVSEIPPNQRGLQATTPPHADQVPSQAESFVMVLKQFPCMWQGLLALKNDQAAVQMYFVSGNNEVAKCCLPKNVDGSTPPLRIFQRMRLEPPQVEGVARKMQMENEHCVLLALPCGHDHMDVLKQSTNLTNGFITYLQQKQAAGIVNVAAPGTTQPPAYVVHIFPSCDFVYENLRRFAPTLLEKISDIAHLLIVITTV